ncbi:MAG TPA: TadE/TadG family type IV pilus assembly protein [Dongiaceae bacterium]|nr:TadE/TadG family type IV pilus assembly protein [Dongiaceae bacterium]
MLKRLWQRADGATALEFALVSPVLFMVSMGAIEGGLMMFNMITIEGGLREASRYGTTGQQTTDDRVKEIVDVLNRYAVGPVTIDRSNVSMKQYDSFSDVGKPEPYTDTNNNSRYDVGEPYTDINNNGQWDADQGASGPGSGGQVVKYTVTYNWKIMTPILRPFLGSGGQLPLTASVVVENEPCPISTATCSTSGNGWTSQ